MPPASAATSGHAAPPTSATLTWTSRIGDLFGPGDGKTRTYPGSSYDFNISAVVTDTETLVSIGPGNIGIIASSKDLVKFTNPAILIGFTTPNAKPFIPGTYKVTSSTGTHTKESPDGSASVHFSTPTPLGSCNSENTAGSFTVTRADYEVVPIDGTKLTAFHPLALQIHFELRCTSSSGVFAGDFVMKDNSFPDGIPWSPTATDGTGTGSGTPQPASAGPTVVLPDSIIAAPLVMANSTSAIVPFSTFIPTTVTGDVALTATTDTDSVLASISPAVIPLGASGDSILTIRTTANTLAGDHSITITASDGVTTPGSATVFFTIICDPPFILGIDQPKSSTVSAGRPALLSVKASGSGPFSYQWFTGSSGLVNFPLAGGTTANFTTSAINDTTSYWVRVTNPCGSADSQAATVSVSAGAKAARR